MCVYWRTKFQFSRVILTSFRQGGNFPSATPLKRETNPWKELESQIRVKLKQSDISEKMLKQRMVLNGQFSSRADVAAGVS